MEASNNSNTIEKPHVSQTIEVLAKIQISIAGAHKFHREVTFKVKSFAAFEQQGKNTKCPILYFI